MNTVGIIISITVFLALVIIFLFMRGIRIQHKREDKLLDEAFESLKELLAKKAKECSLSYQLKKYSMSEERFQILNDAMVVKVMKYIADLEEDPNPSKLSEATVITINFLQRSKKYALTDDERHAIMEGLYNFIIENIMIEVIKKYPKSITLENANL